MYEKPANFNNLQILNQMNHRQLFPSTIYSNVYNQVIPIKLPNNNNFHNVQKSNPPINQYLTYQQLTAPNDQLNHHSQFVLTQQYHTNHNSILNTFNCENHIKSLIQLNAQIKPSDIKQKLWLLIRQQIDLKFADIFIKSIDPMISLKNTKSLDEIKDPINLSTVQKRLESGYYHTLKAFMNDVLSIYNKIIYCNPKNSDKLIEIRTIAKKHAQVFMIKYNNLIHSVKQENIEKRFNQNACNLCYKSSLLFEPPAVYCYETTCGNVRIKRGCIYYVSPDDHLCWCASCYNSLKDTIAIDDNSSIPKVKLVKKKNNNLSEENWISMLSV